MISHRRSLALVPLLSWLLWGGGIAESRVLAQRVPQPRVSAISAPVELEWLNAAEIPGDRNIITSTTISTAGLTPPSLWWTQQKVGGKLLKGWIAYPANRDRPAYADLVVNRQLWDLSDYLERYRFVHHFGQAAQTFGYTVRVFNDVGEYLAAYPCVILNDAAPENGSSIPRSEIENLTEEPELPSLPDNRRQRSCSIILNSSGLGALQDNDSFSNF